MAFLKEIPTRVWLVVCFVVLLTLYYIRPDPVTVDLVKTFSGALLLALRVEGQPPPPQQPHV